MNLNILTLFTRFARYGVLHREQVKNDILALDRLISLGFVCKVYNSGRVFYELTEAAIPPLEQYRKKLLEEARLCLALDKNSQLFDSILGDLRFLDDSNPDAQSFLFLGDWQLTRPVTPAKLELAKLRFYNDHVSRRTRKIA